MTEKKLKILFVCIYSYPSICGVWSRIFNLSNLLVKEGHEVHVFSTNIVKGNNEKSDPFEIYNGIKIHRFNPKFSFGENVKFWNFSSDLKKLNPDLVVAEVYRHPHTNLALKIAKKIKKPCILVTHAPFVESKLRGKKNNFIANLYDKFYGKKIINKFDKIISITKWELPYLSKIGLNKKKLVYIPNGIPEEFFKTKTKEGKDILFLGRVSPIKNLEVLLKAFKEVSKNNPKIKLRIVGPSESFYEKKLKYLIKELKITKMVKFLPPVYNLHEKIKLIDESEIFVLPSKREAMPQSLIEVMSRGKIVIASENDGTKEIIQHEKNGFLFEQNNHEKLTKLINFCLDKKNKDKLKKIRKKAIFDAENFRWKKIYTQFKKLIKEHPK